MTFPATSRPLCLRHIDAKPDNPTSVGSRQRFAVTYTPKGIRTPVASVKGRCPRPLDDGGEAVISELSVLLITCEH